MKYSQVKEVLEEIGREGFENLGEDVVEAALECGISPEDIEKAYQGQFKDDEDFAYEMAFSLGYIDKDQH